MKQILLVDDETNILSALKRELLATGEFAVETYASPVAALERAKEKIFDLVVVDYKMPEMDGVAFLDAFLHLQPDTARVMLSGQVDWLGLVESINLAHIYRFVSKPWHSSDLLDAIHQALAHRHAILENRRLAAEYEAKRGRWTKVYVDKEYRILVVDDDPNVLHAITRDLLYSEHYQAMFEAAYSSAGETHHFQFSVESTTSATEALEWAERTVYDLVISDYAMPEMDGVRFLEAFRRIQPDVACMVLSGNARMQQLVDAINRAEITHFIAKPWNGCELRKVVSQALAYRNLLLDNQQMARELRYGVDGLTV